MTLLQETVNKLKDNGKNLDDVVWVGCRDFKIPKSDFIKLSDREYDSGFGAAEVATDLLIVGNGWYMERQEYDGSEWWEFKALMDEPVQIKKVSSLFTGMWNQLADGLIKTVD